MKLHAILITLFLNVMLDTMALHAEPMNPSTESHTFSNNHYQHLAVNDNKHSKRVNSRKGDIQVPDEIWQAVTNTTNVAEGNGNKEVYIFFDPFCVHCHLLWKDSRQFNATTNHWIPVAEMYPESKFLTAALIESGTQEDLETLMTTNKIPPIQPTSEHIKKYEANANILKRLGIAVYPVVFYTSGDKHYLYRGAPKGRHLQEIFGSN